MSFWVSDVGQLTGEAKDAFTQNFKIIPDDTRALARIMKFFLVERNGRQHYEIDWELVDGEFKGRHVFQKIHAFDADAKKKHRALNMMMLLYKTNSLQPKHNNAPTDADLMAFAGKICGIRIQEWSAPKEDGTMMEGNWVSEVHPPAGFKSSTGVKQEVVHTKTASSVDSAFSRNAPPVGAIEDDIPF
jgi:hypothetical protein